jgi:hypothetical protein
MNCTTSSVHLELHLERHISCTAEGHLMGLLMIQEHRTSIEFESINNSNLHEGSGVDDFSNELSVALVRSPRGVQIYGSVASTLIKYTNQNS